VPANITSRLVITRAAQVTDYLPPSSCHVPKLFWSEAWILYSCWEVL